MLFSVTILYMLSSLHPIMARHFHQHEMELQQWVSFKTQFNKTYGSDDEDYRRMKIYLDNADEITKHNELFKKGKVSFRMALNKFSDLTLEEFSQLYLSKKGMHSIKNGLSDGPIKTFINSTAPEEMNWLDEGIVTGVKNQGNCGSCWAFAATAAIESYVAKSTAVLKDLSPQNILDCSKEEDPCCGGFESDAFEYVMNKGIELEEDYPYQEQQEDSCDQTEVRTLLTTNKGYSCKYRSQKVATWINDYRYVPSEGDEDVLKNVVGNIGPVTAEIDAGCIAFTSYGSGVMKTKLCSNDPDKINHAVLIVGYGATEEGEEYWLVKNSWGEDWGDKGYIKIARNLNNTCGIANVNYYPII